MWIRDFSAVLLAGLFIILPAGACAPAGGPAGRTGRRPRRWRASIRGPELPHRQVGGRPWRSARAGDRPVSPGRRPHAAGLRQRDLPDGRAAEVTVDLTSIDTKLPVRDGNIIRAYFDTAVYPRARADLQVVSAEQQPGGQIRVQATAELDLHGARSSLAPVTLELEPVPPGLPGANPGTDRRVVGRVRDAGGGVAGGVRPRGDRPRRLRRVRRPRVA